MPHTNISTPHTMIEDKSLYSLKEIYDLYDEAYRKGYSDGTNDRDRSHNSSIEYNKDWTVPNLVPNIF